VVAAPKDNAKECASQKEMVKQNSLVWLYPMFENCRIMALGTLIL
jgi:hypothetical protein